MAFMLRWIVAIASMAGLTAHVAGQGTKLSDLLLPTDAAAVIGSTYGQANVVNLAAALHASADPACRASRKLDDGRFRAGAREMLVDYFSSVRKHWADVMDSNGFKVAFEKRFGRASLAEWKAMLAEPTMRRRLEVWRPTLGATLIDDIMNMISQADVLDGRSIKAQFGIASGDAPLLALAGEQGEEMDATLKVVDAANPSLLAPRFDAMMAVWQTMKADAYTYEAPSSAWVQAGPRHLVEGLAARLEKLCLKRQAP